MPYKLSRRAALGGTGGLAATGLLTRRHATPPTSSALGS
jgi:hypothetical protein